MRTGHMLLAAKSLAGKDLLGFDFSHLAHELGGHMMTGYGSPFGLKLQP